MLSVETVYSHLKHIMRKLAVHSRGEAIEAGRELRGSAASHDSNHR